MATLKPCPFCGSRKSKLGAYEGVGESIHFVICLGCQADGPVRNTEEAAIEAWNRRFNNTRKPPSSDGGPRKD